MCRRLGASFFFRSRVLCLLWEERDGVDERHVAGAVVELHGGRLRRAPGVRRRLVTRPHRLHRAALQRRPPPVVGSGSS